MEQDLQAEILGDTANREKIDTLLGKILILNQQIDTTATENFLKIKGVLTEAQQTHLINLQLQLPKELKQIQFTPEQRLQIREIMKSSKKNTREMVPCLGNAPGLGWFFRGTSRSTGKNELVLLITPEVFENDRKRLDEEAIEKAKKVEEELEKGPLPPYQEFFDLPWQ